MDTSTKKGQEMRKRILADKKEKALVRHYKRRYEETGDKKYVQLVSNITGEGDYIPGVDDGEARTTNAE